MRGLLLEGLIFGEAYLRREICVSKSYIAGKKFNVFALFCFVFEGNFKVQPLEGLIFGRAI